MRINCMNCGAPLNDSAHCPRCGFDVVVQKKVYLLSNLYYNQGLEKAEIRDLSGAIDMLQRSLKFNKLNIQARNLLGLVYFETGEAVSALSEWVISKNIMPEGNIASEYIDRLQNNANKLDDINLTIKKYNEALMCCRNGSSDMAAIALKKILTQNPKLIKAHHLLALIYIHRKEYEKARKILKKAARIDKTNATTLRFLKEVDEQTGTRTNLEGRWNFRRGKDRQEESQPASVADVIIPPTFRESSVFSTILNLGFGIIVGALVVWFLFMPGRAQRINREANERVTEYSNTMASQSAELSRLEEQIDDSKETVDSAQEQIEEARNQVSGYENLIKAWQAYQDGSYTEAANAMADINSDQLSAEARTIYDDIFANIQTTLFNSYKEAGIEAFDQTDYAGAVEQLVKAMEINDSDYETLNYLAHAYRESGDTQHAVETFQRIIELEPDTEHASSAQSYIDAMNSQAVVVDPQEGTTDPQTTDQNADGQAAEQEVQTPGETENNADISAEEDETADAVLPQEE